MHPQFAEWYRPLMLQADDKFLKSRWELVEKTAKDLSATMALDLVRLSFGLPVQDDAAMATLKQQLKSESLSYVRATAHLELSLIGDCVLLEALKQSSSKLLGPHIRLMASALTTQQGVRKNLNRSVQTELLVSARALIDRIAVRRRRLLNGKPSKVEIPPREFRAVHEVEEIQREVKWYDDYRGRDIKATMMVPSTEDINQVALHVHELLEIVAAVDRSQRNIADTLNMMSGQIASALEAPKEENDIQWYLLGETSRDLHRPFASFKIAELVPIAASELAVLTRVVPGLYAALAYLDRILTQACTREQAEAMVSVASIVDAVTPMWKEECVSISGFDGVQDLTPVLCALTYATAGSDDWRTMVPELCQVPIDTELSARELAYQLYQEILFARLAKEQLASKGVK